MTAPRSIAAPDRPQVAIVCSPGGSAALRPLAGALARRVDLRSLGRADRPIALLASDPEALQLARREGGEAIPPVTAVIVDGHLLVETSEAGEGGTQVSLPLAPGIATSPRPPLAPHVRRRWRERLGLPDALVVDPAALDPDDVPTALAVASAAVVDARYLATALALGCPTVTDAASAASVGAIDGHDLVVGGRAEAEALALDDERAARLSRNARRLAVTRLDPESTAIRVLDLWGLLDHGPAGRVQAALAALGTRPGSAPARRAADALALFSPGPTGGR